MRILLVDDHTLFRKGTALILGSFDEIGSVDEAEGGKEALSLLKKNRYDIMLLDLEMPGMDGRQVAKIAIDKYPDLRVIMLSSHKSLDIVSEMIEIGIHCYLVKDAKPEELKHAIVSVIKNDFFYNQLVSSALKAEAERYITKEDTEDKTGDISQREIQILALICQELTMKEIGKKLNLSEQTVHTHRKNLLKKTKAKNTVGLVKYAFQKHIITF